MEATATLNKICHELGVCEAVRGEAERRAKLKKGEIITCRYCGTKFPHSGRVELQVCPGCGAKLLTNPPGELGKVVPLTNDEINALDTVLRRSLGTGEVTAEEEPLVEAIVGKIEDPPGEEVPREELTKFALKLVALFRGQAAGIIKVPKLKDWAKEELEGTADLMLEDLRQERPEVLKRLRTLYQETGGEPFEEIYYSG